MVDIRKQSPLTNEEENHSIFGLLSRIYASPLLTNTLKHYYACRVFCLAYNASSASILLYDGGKERLISKGIYLHRGAIRPLESKYQKSQVIDKYINEDKLHVIRYIGFYHYLLSIFASTRLPHEVEDEHAYRIAKSYISKKYLSYDLSKKVDIIVGEERQIKSIDQKEDLIAFVQYCLQNSRKHATDENGELYRSPSSYYYLLHNELVIKEQYKIGPNVDTFSGRLYHTLTLPNSITNDLDLILRTEDDLNPTKKDGEPTFTPKTLINNLRSLGLKFRSHQYYVGVPLISSGRCIGILRLLFPKGGVSFRKPKPGHLLYYSQTNPDQHIRNHLTDKDRNQDLLYSIEILGNLLEQTYPLGFLHNIPKDGDFIRPIEGDEINNPYNEWCTALQKAINCHGCMLRFKDSSLVAPTRVGHSSSIDEYINSLRLAGDKPFIIKDGKFHSALASIFPDINTEVMTAKLNSVRDMASHSKKKERKIVAVLIDFGNEYNVESTKVLRYYYVDGKSETVKSTNYINDLTPKYKELILIDKKHPENSLVTSEYHKHFTGSLFDDPELKDRINHQGRYMLIIDIPSIELAGVVTFSNSCNRKFSLNDVRFAYNQVSRLGASISHLYSASINLAISNSMHRLSNINTDLSDILKRLHNGGINSLKIAQLESIASKLQKRIHSLTEYNGACFLNDLAITEEKPYNFCSYIKEMITTEFSDEAQGKGLKIDIVDYCGAELKTIINKKCLWLSIEGILENALKFSWCSEDMQKPQSICYVAGFKKDTPVVPGNISVSLKEKGSYIQIDIKNYGPSLNNTQYEGGETNSIRTYSSHGIGLHLVKSFLSRINSEFLVPQQHQQGVIFSVKIKYK